MGVYPFMKEQQTTTKIPVIQCFAKANPGPQTRQLGPGKRTLAYIFNAQYEQLRGAL